MPAAGDTGANNDGDTLSQPLLCGAASVPLPRLPQAVVGTSSDTGRADRPPRRLQLSKAALEALHAQDDTASRHRVPSVQNLNEANRQSRRWPVRFRHFLYRRWQRKCRAYALVDYAALLFPCVGWLRGYSWRHSLTADVVAGLTVGIMTVPQSLSYARIAGLPSEFGLYGAFAPVLCYAVFGSSRQLAVGPVAITSLLLSNGLSNLIPGAEENIEPNDPANPAAQREYNIAAVQVSVLVALMYCALGAARLGFLTNFLSHSVISGFVTGAAVVIGVSQVKLLLGFHVPRGRSCLQTTKYLATHLHETKPLELALGVLWLATLLIMKHFGKSRRHDWRRWLRPLGPLTVSALAIGAVWALHLDVRTMGHIPAGLPPLTVRWWLPPEENFWDLTAVAATLTVVGLMESIAIAKSLADQSHHTLDPNQELVGLGLANLAGGAFNAYPTTGGFSRSAVNADSGAVSGLAGACTAVFVGFTLLVATPAFEHMPHCALGAIVISSVVGLLQWREAAFLWRIAKLDWLVWLTCCLGTIFLSVGVGLALSIGLALLFVVYESAYPHTAVLGNLPHTNVYRNMRQYPEAHEEAGLLLVRLDAPLYFANVQYVRDQLRKYEARAQEAKPDGRQPAPLRFVVVDLSPVSHIDATAVRMLGDLAADLAARQLRLAVSNPSERVFAMFERSGLLETIGPDYVFVRIHDAVQFCKTLMAADGERAASLQSV